MRWIQYNTIASILNVPDADAHSRFFSLLSLSLSLFLYGWEHNREEKKKIFWEKYKQWIRIISFFNNSTWLAVCYSKGVSVYCSLSPFFFFSRSSLITGSRVRYIEANDRFRSFPLLAERNREKERRRSFFSLLLRQYAAIRCNGFFDWRIRPKIQPIISIVKKEKFIRIFYCLLLLHLMWLHMHPLKFVKKYKWTNIQWKNQKLEMSNIKCHLFVY